MRILTTLNIPKKKVKRLELNPKIRFIRAHKLKKKQFQMKPLISSMSSRVCNAKMKKINRRKSRR